MKRQDQTVAWLDFARGVADPEVDREIRRRLTSGSEKDRKEVDLWRRVADVGRSDIEQQKKIPGMDGAMRIVQAMGRMYLPQPQDLRSLVAERIFGHQPMPVGVRSGASEHVHSVYSADDYLFDVRLETLIPGGFRLDGQISRDDEDEIGGEVSVLAYQGEELLGSMICDDAGEFHSSELVEAPSQLHFLVGETLRVEVPLG